MIHIFHSKTKFVDVLTFNFCSFAYLLQARKCKKCGRAYFRVAKPGGSIVHTHDLPEKRLKEVGFFQKVEVTA